MNTGINMDSLFSFFKRGKLIISPGSSRSSINIFLFLAFLVYAPASNAEIYHCLDESGKTVFKDKECDAGEDSIEIIENIEESGAAEEEEEKVPNNIVIEDDRPGSLIFSNTRKLSPPYTIKVDEVRIITETDDLLVVDVIYTYKHKIPAEEIKIYVTPNHAYWSVNQIQASAGTNVARATIGLSKSNMKKDRVRKSFTNTIGVRFEHYKPGKYLGVIWSEIIKYEKNWELLKG